MTGPWWIEALALQAAAVETARIDARTALLECASAPLAELGGDHRAVWAAVPERRDGSVLVFFHGNDGFVTASAAKPRGYRPAWAPGGAAAEAVGSVYDLDRIASSGPTGPVVLAPEVGIAAPEGGIAWATTSSGAFARDRATPDALGRMVADAVGRLRGIGLLPETFAPGRLLVAAHSGGGRVLAALLPTETLRSGPVDLWMLDATYGWGEPDDYARTVASWRDRGHLQGPGHSRLVLAYLADTQTEADARAIVSAVAKLGISAATVGWNDPRRDELLRTLPVVALEVPKDVVSHGAVPLELLPLLLRTLPNPEESAKVEPKAEF